MYEADAMSDGLDNPHRETSVDGKAVSYDHLVLALGSVPDHKGLYEVREFAFDFKTLQDAIRIRNHVIACFERAEQEKDPRTRKSLVTFLIAGGGFAGAELAGALNDFVHGLLIHYPSVTPEDVEVIVAHSGNRIMPELSETLSSYALERMRERGVTFYLNTYGEGVDMRSGTVSLSTDETIRTETLVWTAGNRPNPLIGTLDVPQTRGAITVDSFLSVSGRERLWAAGDCAAIPDPDTGDRYPNTAEHASRASKVLADNIHTTVVGGEKTRFGYTSPGSLVVIGYQTACVELWGRRFSGLFAWFLWRIVYLFKLPGTDRKVRVLTDWLIEIVFPRELVQTFGVDDKQEGQGFTDE